MLFHSSSYQRVPSFNLVFRFQEEARIFLILRGHNSSPVLLKGKPYTVSSLDLSVSDGSGRVIKTLHDQRYSITETENPSNRLSRLRVELLCALDYR